jgi:hypothetical protein
MTVCLALSGAFACAPEQAMPRRYGGAGGAGGAGGTNVSGSGGTMFSNPELPSGGSSGASGQPIAGAAGNESCAEGLANTTPVTPTVWLVLDGSGSMNEDFGDETRWQALRAALMDDGGIVSTLERNVRFGMVLYSGAESDDDEPPPAQCVDLVVVDPALDNYAALQAQLPDEEPGGWTPTDQALEHVVDNLPVTNMPVLDGTSEPTYVVLATDGAPNDRCAGDSGGGGGGRDFDEVTAQRVLDVVGRGASAGVKLLVISLAGDDDDLQTHLEEVATLSGSGLAPFVPATRDELVTTFQQIIGGASCQIALQGMVMADQACSGTVTLSGTPLVCNDDNGFRVVDGRTLQLMGDACSNFLAVDSQLHATFPCGAFTPD